MVSEDPSEITSRGRPRHRWQANPRLWGAEIAENAEIRSSGHLGGFSAGLRLCGRGVGTKCVEFDVTTSLKWQRVDGRLSDMANLSRAKDAALGAAIRDLAWDTA